MPLEDEVLSSLGPLAEPAAAVTADLIERDAVRRLFDGDHTLWRDDPTELADRLGWLPVIAEMEAALDDITARSNALAAANTHVLVMGMGGSSLFPEVLARTFGPIARGLELHVLDTTDPAAIERIASQCPVDSTVYLASSKSGSTIETRSHLEWAWARSGDPRKFAVVTDPGSELAALARDRGFAEVFENRSDIGGRYSALSLFGLVPALLAGVDAAGLLAGAKDALVEFGPDADPRTNHAVVLASAWAAGVKTGRDKLTFSLQPAVASLGLWLEQLIAESLGKDGTGVVPIVGEELAAPAVYGDDRIFVLDSTRGGVVKMLNDAGHPALNLRCDPTAERLGHTVVLAEIATALCGAAIGVQPFDQPDVAAAKAATNDVLAAGGAQVDEVPVEDLLAQIRPGDHLAIQAFVDPAAEWAEPLQAARNRLRDQHKVATSLGYGPRFLHSTGQLHKGGPDSIVCVQVASPDPDEIPIPGRDFGFGHLKQAQAAGDLRTLQERGIRAGRVSLEALTGLAR